MKVLIFVTALITLQCCSADPGINEQWVYPTSAPLIQGTFPKNFIWSIATAAYQIEGAWNASGKGPNIWDTMVHKNPDPIKMNGTGDVACDSYHKWQVDIQLLKRMGLKYYRFSISWARVLQTGLINSVNPAGVTYYKTLIQELQANGIEPMITMYHWDLPQNLQGMGGWQNENSSNWFLDYAKLCYQSFPTVKYWITFNEPWCISWLGYGLGVFAPQVGTCPGTCPYIVTHNLLKAHAKAWHTYNETYRATQKGQVGITINCDWMEPGSTRQQDIDAAERANQFMCGWLAHPIFSQKGDYPAIMKSIVANRSSIEGLNHSRLLQFSPQEVAYIKGAYDFFGLNMYTTKLAWNQPNNDAKPSYANDQQMKNNQSSTWPTSGSDWLKFTPWGARKLLNWIKTRYNNPPVLITENGWSDTNGSLSDSWRIHYYQWYINNVLQAIKLDGCNVKGYTAWSLLDNFEWTSGYTQKFGMNYVNFSDPNRPRMAKDSAMWYAKLVQNNGWPITPQTGGATVVRGGSIFGMALALLNIVWRFFQ